jgi:hypothetical protein
VDGVRYDSGDGGFRANRNGLIRRPALESSINVARRRSRVDACFAPVTHAVAVRR